MRRGSISRLKVVVPTLALLILASVSGAQIGSYRVLHAFSGGTGDGEEPQTQLVLDRAGNLYGTTVEGGSDGCSTNGCGTAFELSQQYGHWGERVLLSFSNTNNFFPSPIGTLAMDSIGNIYGTNQYTGDPSCNCGAIFELTKSGGVWTQNILHNFLGGTSDGQYPQSGLIRDQAGNLYGTTLSGGTDNAGTIFELSPSSDGTWTYSVIHLFVPNGTDGSYPYGPLTIDKSGNLYGTTWYGGIDEWGTVFRLSPSDGAWTETILYNFALDYGVLQEPDGVITDAAGNLYGATIEGGEYSLGTIYKLTPTFGYWNRTLLYTFTGNNDGVNPRGSLTIDKSGNLYGTASFGGLHSYGTVYKLVPGQHGRWNIKILHSFAGSDGGQPMLGVVLDHSGDLYGLAGSGGAYGFGVAFEIVP